MSVSDNVVSVVNIESLTALDPSTPGIHRRLLAGLESFAGRAGNSVVVRVEPGPTGDPYHDYDTFVVVTMGCAGGGIDGRNVDGHIKWPMHVSGEGRVTISGLRGKPEIDITVWSKSLEGEATKFVGSFELLDDEVVGRMYRLMDKPVVLNQDQVERANAAGLNAPLVATVTREEVANAWLVDRYGYSRPVHGHPTTVGHELCRLCRKIVGRAALASLLGSNRQEPR